jgi:hypothetical protein
MHRTILLSLFTYLLTLNCFSQAFSNSDLTSTWYIGYESANNMGACCMPNSIVITPNAANDSILDIAYNYASVGSNAYCQNAHISGPVTSTLNSSAHGRWIDNNLPYTWNLGNLSHVLRGKFSYENGNYSGSCSFLMRNSSEINDPTLYYGAVTGTWANASGIFGQFDNKPTQTCCIPNSTSISQIGNFPSLSIIYTFGPEVVNNSWCIMADVLPGTMGTVAKVESFVNMNDTLSWQDGFGFSIMINASNSSSIQMLYNRSDSNNDYCAFYLENVGVGKIETMSEILTKLFLADLD